MKLFYDHLVLKEDLIVELEKHKLAVEEREELVALVDENLHHHVLDTILTHLPKEKHQDFLKKFHNAPHDEKLLEYLKTETVVDIEEEIKTRARKTKAELLAEIKRARRK